MPASRSPPARWPDSIKPNSLVQGRLPWVHCARGQVHPAHRVPEARHLGKEGDGRLPGSLGSPTVPQPGRRRLADIDREREQVAAVSLSADGDLPAMSSKCSLATSPARSPIRAAAGSNTRPTGPSASSSRPPADTAPSRSRPDSTSSPPPTRSPDELRHAITAINGSR